MPGLDQTGPRGQGPKTGRGLGVCSPKKQTPSVPNGIGRGQGGTGRGQGPRGRRKGPNGITYFT